MQDGDAAVLIAGRDAEFHRFMGEGSPDPGPTAIIEVDGDVVGWVDHDDSRTWLGSHECNVGYHVFAVRRGQGIAQRAVRLLLELLASEGTYSVATFLIDADNQPSLHVAAGVGATERWRRVEPDGRTNVFLSVPIRGGPPGTATS
jgi:RimJ/RimL family protein N-acetyltransferase